MADLFEAPAWLTDITLEPAATVVGCVADEQGNGVVNAQVQARLSIAQRSGELWRPPGLGPSTHTDENGYYQLSGLPAGGVSISAFSNEAHGIGHKLVYLAPGEMRTLNFVDDSSP